MIKAAIDKIQSLVEENNKIIDLEINGKTYSELDLRMVSDIPKRATINLNSLDGLISYIHADVHEQSKDNLVLPLRFEVKEQSVIVRTSADENKTTNTLYDVKSQHPYIDLNSFVSPEEMIIQLQTNFVDSENKKRLITMLSNLKQESIVELADDGVTQVVSSKSGVTSTSTVTIPPLVKLVPQRTFFEVEQPEQMFLVRISKGGNVALFDAGGGVWKHDCQLSIRKYLRNRLSNLIEDGTVVIG